MLKIRLARVGKKKKPTYRFVVSESARDMYGKALEILGHYNPFSKVIEVDKERILYWISKGAQLSPTVHNLLVDQNVISGDKVRASKGKKKKKDGEGSDDEAKKDEAKPGETKEEKPAKEPKKDEPKAEEKKLDEKPVEEKTEEKKEEKPAEEPKKDEPKPEEKTDKPKEKKE